MLENSRGRTGPGVVDVGLDICSLIEGMSATKNTEPKTPSRSHVHDTLSMNGRAHRRARIDAMPPAMNAPAITPYTTTAESAVRQSGGGGVPGWRGMAPAMSNPSGVRIVRHADSPPMINANTPNTTSHVRRSFGGAVGMAG